MVTFMFHDFTEKKNRKIKGRVKKKKQQAEFKINYNIPTKTALRTKVKDFHKRLIAEVKDKENNKLVDNVKSKTKSSVIITSTPVPNKNGLTDMSNFLFSPIEKMQENDIITVNSKKQINNVSIAISTPKTLFRKTSKIEVEPNQDNCIRVLRSRKILLS